MSITMQAAIPNMAQARAALKELGDKTERRIVRTAIRKAGNLVAADARKRVKASARRGSRIGKAISVHVSVTNTRESAKVGIKQRAGARHAHLLERGTAPHDIRPRARGGKQVMAWKGRAIYGKKVRHPGARARPFLRPALEQNHAAIADIFAAELARQVEKARAAGAS